jgi:Mor family transcriptional regulator
MNYNGAGKGTALKKNDVFEELEDIFGAEAANRFVDFYAGSNLYVPKNIKIERKHRKIRDEFREGATYRELAMRYEYTEQHIRNIVHRKERKNG